MDKDREEDVNELLDAIVWGRRIVEIPDNEDGEQVFVFRPLTLEERNMGNYIYKQALRHGKKAGIATREQLIKDAITYDLWRVGYEKEAESLRKEWLKVSEELTKEEEANKKRRSPTTKLVRLRARHAHIVDTLHQIDEDRTRYIDLPSVEHMAECQRGNYYLHCATLTFPEMNQVWPTLQSLEEETNTTMAAYLLRAYYRETIADESEIRRVARSGIWRCKWSGSKKNGGVKTLFNRDMYDLTIDQFRLMYWSQIYDSAFESMDVPSDDVIEDDKLFDRWLDDQHQKRKQERKKSAFDKKISRISRDGDEVAIPVLGEYCKECICGVKETASKRPNGLADSTHDASCSYGVFIYYNKDKKASKIEEVQSANPERTRRVLANEQKRLADLGVEGAEEQKLRGDKTRQALGLSTTTHGAGEYGKGKRGRA
jgi:hypothetical protein